jgi:alpha-galactosidase
MNKNMFAPVPPMGWNSFDTYGAAVTEEELKHNIDFMAEHLKSYGYEYIVCDIQWYEPGAVSSSYRKFADLCMDEYGRLIPAPNRFPSAEGGKGFAPIAQYVHNKGLKFGIHVMRGIPRQAVSQNTKSLWNRIYCGADQRGSSK